MHTASSNARRALTPEILEMLQAIAKTGSFAAAARAIGVVPSSLTYRVQHVEQALGVRLFERHARKVLITEAGKELIRGGALLLDELDALSNRIRRVASGWEAILTIAVDAIVDRAVVLEMCKEFIQINSPTRIRLRYEALSGTLEALSSGNADLAIGIVSDVSGITGLTIRPMGRPKFVFVVAPDHPLAAHSGPLSDEILMKYRAVAVADSTTNVNAMTIGLLPGQEVFTVPDMQAKLQAQLLGLGIGFLPERLAQAHVDGGALVKLAVKRSERQILISYGFRTTPVNARGKALEWWINRLASVPTQKALIGWRDGGSNLSLRS